MQHWSAFRVRLRAALVGSEESVSLQYKLVSSQSPTPCSIIQCRVRLCAALVDSQSPIPCSIIQCRVRLSATLVDSQSQAQYSISLQSESDSVQNYSRQCNKVRLKAAKKQSTELFILQIFTKWIYTPFKKKFKIL